MPKLTTQEANEMLPTKKSKAEVNPLGLVYLAIAPPKFGKTTFFCDFEDSLLLAFEKGHAFQEAHKFEITAWAKRDQQDIETDDEGVYYGTMERVVELLEASDKFKFLIMDTADMAAKMCLDYHLRKMGLQHAQDGGDFGKGYDITQNAPFRQMVGRLMKTGRGIAFITHQQISTNKFAKGEKAKKETTLPGGVFKFLYSQADVILHGEFGKKSDKVRDRVWRTEGDEDTLAGARIKTFIPPCYIINPENPYQQWCKLFQDEAFAEKEYARFLGKTEEEPAPDSAPRKAKA